MIRFFKLAFSILMLATTFQGASCQTLYGDVSHTDQTNHITDNLQNHAPTAAITHPPVQANFPEPPGTNQSAGYIPDYGVGHPQSDQQQVSTPLLRAGTSTLNYNIEWFKIPKWMAGAWFKDGDLTTQETDLRTGMSVNKSIWTDNKMQVIWGHQQDALGNIWHVNLLPSERDGTSAGKKVRFVTLKQFCEQSTEQQMITRTLYAVGEFDALRGQPIDSFQQESLNHYAYGPQGELVNVSSNRVFNYAGRPMRDGQILSKYTKLGGFKPMENLRGVDLKAALKDYLSSQGAMDAIPRDNSDTNTR